MSRHLVAAAQLGPIHRADSRESVVRRLVDLMRQAADRGCRLVVYPELALTTFFPRWLYDSQDEVDAWFEHQMPNAATPPLFDEAKRLGIGFHLGYAELCEENGATRRFNTAILVGPHGAIVGKYRKIHLPGTAEPVPDAPFQHLEKRAFEVGNLGFPVWSAHGAIVGMCICNDRRWPETFRVMGLKGAEMVVLGYNTPDFNIHADEPKHLRMFHNHVTIQANAYQNGCWVIASAEAGREDGFGLIGGSCIIAPTGEIASSRPRREARRRPRSCSARARSVGIGCPRSPTRYTTPAASCTWGVAPRLSELQPRGVGARAGRPQVGGARGNDATVDGHLQLLARRVEACDEEGNVEIEALTQPPADLAGLAVGVDDEPRQVRGQEDEVVEAGGFSRRRRRRSSIALSFGASCGSVRAIEKMSSRCCTE